jgi:hypothetical protein
MGKLIAGVLVILGILAVAVFFAAQPSVPRVVGSRTNPEVAKLCLSDIEQQYSGQYLTYAGHVKAWAAYWTDKLGLGLSSDQKAFLVGYALFEEAVSCYVSLSGDLSLNMVNRPGISGGSNF